MNHRESVVVAAELTVAFVVGVMLAYLWAFRA
jgi:hypothetical protein